MTRREFLRYIKRKYGIKLKFVRHAKGSHEIWKHKHSDTVVHIPHKLAGRNVKNAEQDIHYRVRMAA